MHWSLLSQVRTGDDAFFFQEKHYNTTTLDKYMKWFNCAEEVERNNRAEGQRVSMSTGARLPAGLITVCYGMLGVLHQKWRGVCVCV